MTDLEFNCAFQMLLAEWDKQRKLNGDASDEAQCVFEAINALVRVLGMTIAQAKITGVR